MAEVTGRIGDNDVELNNAATEATLGKLLSQTGINSQYLRELARKAGVDVKKINDAFADIEEATVAATGSTRQLTEEQKKITGGFKASIGIIDAFGQKLIEGTAKTTDLYSALGKSAASFSDLGGGIGKVAAGLGIFFEGLSRVAAFQQKNLESYQQISSAGVNFSGSLTDLRLAAANSYLTLDQFSNLMKNNSQTFAKMGLTVNDGAKAFAHLSKELISSEAGNSLLALGYTTEEVNSSMLSYINATGGRSKQELANTAAITAATTEYMTELDKLTQFSGVSRKQQEEDAKKAASNAAYQRALSNMTEEQKARAEVARQAAANSGIAGAQDAFMARIAGLPPITDEAKQFVGIFGEAANGVNEMADQVKSTTGTMDGVEKGLGIFNEGVSKQVKNLGTSGDALAMTGNKIINSASLYATQLVKGGKDTAEGTAKAFGEISANQKKQQESQAAEMAKANKGLQDLGIALINMISPLVSIITPAFEFVGSILGTFGKVISSAVEFLNSFGIVGKGLVAILSAYLAWKIKEFTMDKAKSLSSGISLGGGKPTVSSPLDAMAGGAGKAGGGLGETIRSIGMALASLGPEAPMILAGAAAIGGSIALIGAGIAGAVWIMGAALPKFAEGLEPFGKIDGVNLIKVAGGIAALGASMVAFAGMSVLSGLGAVGSGVLNFFTGGGVIGQVTSALDKLKPKINDLTTVGTALKIFSDGLKGVSGSISSIDINKGNQIAEMISNMNNASKLKTSGGSPTSGKGATSSGSFLQKAMMGLPPLTKEGATFTAAQKFGGSAMEKLDKETDKALGLTGSEFTPELSKNPEQTGTENLRADIQQLNKTMVDMVGYLKQTADNTDRTHRATKALNGNAFV